MSIKLLNFSIAKYNQKTIIINCALFLTLISVVIGITSIYISQEKYFYFWDHVNYSGKTVRLASAFATSISEGFKQFHNSLSQDYNAIPCLLLVPFTLVFGESRLVFILSCALVYLIPFCLIVGLIATKLIEAKPFTVFWSTAFLTLLFPPIWHPILRGYPDLGAAVIMGLAILVYLKDMRLKHWWQIPSLGFLLGLAILFRRHFAYSVRAFFVAMIFQALILFWTTKKNSRKQFLQNVTRYGLVMVLIAITILFTMNIIAPEFTYRVLNVNYRHLYSSYEIPMLDVFLSFGSSGGWIIMLMSILGYGIGTLTLTLRHPQIYFMILFATVSILQWIMFAKNPVGNHYFTHFTIFFVLGIEALLITIILAWKRKVRFFTLMLTMAFLVLNLIIALTPISTRHNLSPWGISGKYYNWYRPLMAMNNPPLIRQDYEQVNEMIQYLREVTPNSEPIYVAASSLLFNPDVISAAESQLYGEENKKLKILHSPITDSGHFYPLRYFPLAKYVIVANPFQHHLSPQEQDVVKVMVDGFNENWQFAQDFQKIPQSFVLENDITVDIYQRIRPTSLQTILDSLKLMREKIQPKPGSEIDWTVVESEDSDISVGITNDQKNIQIWANLYRKPKSLLYFGKIPESINMEGELHVSNCSGFDGIALQLMALNDNGDVINSTKDFFFLANQTTKFSLSLESQQVTYLYLAIKPKLLPNPTHSDLNPICSVQINNMSLN